VLTGLGGDGNAARDGGYNITWSNGTITVQATGTPVVLVETTARVLRGEKLALRRPVQAEVFKYMRRVYSKAVCGCSAVHLGGGTLTDSYRSSQAPTAPVPFTGRRRRLQRHLDVASAWS